MVSSATDEIVDGVDIGRAERGVETDDVLVEPAIDRVVPEPADEDIVAGAAIEHVVAVIAAEKCC